MKKYLFVAVPIQASGSNTNRRSKSYENEDLIKYLEDGWSVERFKTVTPPQAVGAGLFLFVLTK